MMSGLHYEEAAPFATFAGVYTLCVLLATSMGRCVASLSASPAVANALVGVILSACSLLCGFLIPRRDIPVYWIWGYYGNFFTYALEAAIASDMQGIELRCGPGEAVRVPINGTSAAKDFCAINTGETFLTYFGLEDSSVGRDLAILAGAFETLFPLFIFFLFASSFTKSLIYFLTSPRLPTKGFYAFFVLATVLALTFIRHQRR
jgi:hypothetical protein